MIKSIVAAKIAINRDSFVYHIAHIPGTPQKSKEGRHDFWNRAEGFNPNNGPRNKRLVPGMQKVRLVKIQRNKPD
jgi:hypothetical protein